ncbi:MAG: hypothetical protein WC356_07445 [Candidatus Micrarchaeia archaeon]|jgi:hypothetical protein
MPELKNKKNEEADEQKIERNEFRNLLEPLSTGKGNRIRASLIENPKRIKKEKRESWWD